MAPTNDAKHATIILGQFGALIGRGLVEILQEDKHLSVLGTDLDGVALERAVTKQTPDIAILDETRMTDPSLLARLLGARPGIGLVVMAHLPSRAYAGRLLAAGATCLSKEASAADICATIHHAAEGRHHLLTPVVDPPGLRAWGEKGGLTPRQVEVLQYMRLGQGYPAIAHALGISVETVRVHARQVRRKFGVRHKSELIGLHGSGIGGNKVS